jgi:hypothetical protein
MSLKDSSLSPCDRPLAPRRTIFIRDWILVLIALGLLIAAGAFHRDRGPASDGPEAVSAATVR